MKVIYLNENDVLPHIGCKAVADAHRILFDRLGIEVVHTFLKNDLWAYKKLSGHEERVAAIGTGYNSLLERVDAIIVNGEGTLHHGRGEDLLAMMDLGILKGKRVFLINALVMDMEAYSGVLSRLDSIVTRDPRSFAEAQRYNVNVSLTFDSFVMADFEAQPTISKSKSQDVFITDYLGTLADGPGYIIDRYLKETDDESQYVPFQSPFQAAKWRGIVNRLDSAKCVVSGRHHGLYAAAMAGRPMVALESNSHKMAAFSEMVDGIIPVVSKYEQLPDAIEAACEKQLEFRALPGLIREKNIVGHYSNVFDLPVNRLSVKAGGLNGNYGRHVGKIQRCVNRFLGIKEADAGYKQKKRRGYSHPWCLTYFRDLQDAKRRRDPRLLPLRSALRDISSQPDSYRRHRADWDCFFRIAKSRSFMLDELAACAPIISDPNLHARLGSLSSRARSHGEYYSVSLSAMFACSGAATPKFRATIEHLKNAIRGDSLGEVAVLLEKLGHLDAKRESQLVNSVIPVLSEEQDYKAIVSLVSLYPMAGIHERNRLKVAEAQFMLGRYQSAIKVLETVREDDDLAKTANHRRGRILVHLGDFENGWPLMNHVVERGHFTQVSERLALPKWPSKIQPGERLLIWFHELGGIGEEILWGQLVLGFQQLTDNSLRLVVDPRLLVLFSGTFPQCEVVSRDAPIEVIRKGAGAFIFARELTRWLIRSGSDFGKVAKTRFKLPIADHSKSAVMQFKRPRIAISWKTTNRASAIYRNVPLEEFGEVLSTVDAEFHCLQHGVIRNDLAVLKSKLGERLHSDTLDPSAMVEDMAAGLLKMDAVVTIDNTTLHIGGCLGIPTLVLLSVPAYWQWPEHGRWSRWYENVKLLRQDAPGHWSQVFNKLREELKQFPSVDRVE